MAAYTDIGFAPDISFMSEPASVPDAGSITPLGGLSGVTPGTSSADLINARALLLGERLDTRGLEGAAPLATAPVAVPISGRSTCHGKAAWSAPCGGVIPCRLAADRSRGLERCNCPRRLGLPPCTHPGLDLQLLNLGGGLPAPIPPLADYVETIETALSREFGAARPRLFIEPGRYLVGDAGLLRAEILLISRKSAHERERSTNAFIIVSARRTTAAPAAR